MLRLITCSYWLINLLACISRKLKLVSVLVLVVRTTADFNHCRSWLVFLNVTLSDFDLVRIDSLDHESTRALTSLSLDCLSFLPAGMTSLTKIIGLKWTCFSFLKYFDFLSFYWLDCAECLIGKNHVILYLSYWN